MPSSPSNSRLPGEVFAERPRVSIVGRTNVGKSSLFNRLLGRDEAIVTQVAGTTRNVLEEELSLDGTELLLVDTAGEPQRPKVEGRRPKEAVRPDEMAVPCAAGPDASGPAGALSDPDHMAIARARAELAQADLVLLVIDASDPLTAIDIALINRLAGGSPLPPLAGGEGQGLPAVASAKAGEGRTLLSPLEGEGRGEGCTIAGEAEPLGASVPSLIVLNKTDLPKVEETERFVRRRGLVVPVSCATGSGFDRLREEIRGLLTVRGVERAGLRFMLNLRQLDSLRRSSEALARASAAAHDGLGLEFPAAEIRIALNHLRDLTHPLTEDEILDRIFSRFCIGK